jgi:uncharacterized membrane protein
MLLANHSQLVRLDEFEEVTMLKTLSFAAVHFTVAFTIGYLLTGSVLVGGTMALIEPACNTVAYYFHEKAWARFGVRRDAQQDAPRLGNLLVQAH